MGILCARFPRTRICLRLSVVYPFVIPSATNHTFDRAMTERWARDDREKNSVIFWKKSLRCTGVPWFRDTVPLHPADSNCRLSISAALNAAPSPFISSVLDTDIASYWSLYHPISPYFAYNLYFTVPKLAYLKKKLYLCTQIVCKVNQSQLE